MVTRAILISALLVTLLLLVACSSPQVIPTQIAGPTSLPTSTPVQSATPAPSPTSTFLPAPASTLTTVPTLTPTSASAPTQTHVPIPGLPYLTEEIPTCTPISGSSVDPCEPDVNIVTNPLEGVGESLNYRAAPWTIRDYLDGSSIISIPHIVLRGTYIPNTERCTSGTPDRDPSYVDVGYPPTALLFLCYADVRVNGYVLGSGPPRLTVLVNFDHYAPDFFAQGDPLGLYPTGEEGVEWYRARSEGRLREGPRGGVGIGGREVVLFVSPPHSHSIEVWEVFETWDVQRQEDETVVVVHPRRDHWRDIRPVDYQTHRSALEIELPAFTQAVATANQARVSEYSGRITSADRQSRAEGVDLPMLVTDANRLSQFFTAVGAYNHPNGPPEQPPPACGLAVPDQGHNPDLMLDCVALLAAKDALRGTATLNWSVDTAITSWDGVTASGTPSRVTELDLSSEGLTGSIPAEVGNLEDLEQLYLFDNDLTGSIPVEFGNLRSLQILSLYDNDLSGGIPVEVGKLKRLRELLLDGNDLTGGLPTELGALTRLESLYVRDNLLTGAIPTELASLSNLAYLFLDGNSFNGCVPSGLRDVDYHDLDDLGLTDCAT